MKDLTLGEIALIAGLPKAPSTMNPIYSVERATNRRNVVLQRMLDENTSLKQNTMLRVPNLCCRNTMAQRLS